MATVRPDHQQQQTSSTRHKNAPSAWLQLTGQMDPNRPRRSSSSTLLICSPPPSPAHPVPARPYLNLPLATLLPPPMPPLLVCSVISLLTPYLTRSLVLPNNPHQILPLNFHPVVPPPTEISYGRDPHTSAGAPHPCSPRQSRGPMRPVSRIWSWQRRDCAIRTRPERHDTRSAGQLRISANSPPRNAGVPRPHA